MNTTPLFNIWWPNPARQDPLTLANSEIFAVTRVALFLSACAVISKS